MTQYYFGYGMNTNKAGMATRCPDSIDMGKARLDNYKLRFARHADIIKDDNSYIHGVLWKVTDKCMTRLDALEGYPFYYDRILVDVYHNGNKYNSWVYIMQPGNDDALPSQSYFRMLSEGYNEHGIDTEVLYKEHIRLTKKESQVQYIIDM